MIEVLDPGPFASVQDDGRPGLAALGVPRSGAFDRAALHAANRLVGNRPDAAAIELTGGGLVLRCHAAVTLALTGAPCPGIALGVPVSLPPGTLLRLAVARWGLRSYLAVRGGLRVDAVLGSASTDTLSGLGPSPLRAGDRFEVADAAVGAPSSALVAPAPPQQRPVRVVFGPRDDWFTPDAREILLGARWRIRADSNRIGLRLDGPRLVRRDDTELPSEATIPGALQVPLDGRPILFGPDAPVTGGYPVLAVAVDADLDVAAQLRPGDELRFALA